MDTKRVLREAASDKREAFLQLFNRAIDREHARATNNTPGFWFVHVLKSHDELRTCDDTTLLKVAEKGLKMLFPFATDPWKEAFPKDADPKTNFVDACKMVAFPTGDMERARHLAKSIHFHSGLSELFDGFLARCSALSKVTGQTILIPCNKWGAELGVSGMQITRYRRVAKRLGYLIEIEKSVPARKATRFRFVADPSTNTSKTDFPLEVKPSSPSVPSLTSTDQQKEAHSILNIDWPEIKKPSEPTPEDVRQCAESTPERPIASGELSWGAAVVAELRKLEGKQ